MTFPTLQQSESHPWTEIHPRRYLWIMCPLEVYMFTKIRVSKGKYTIQTTERKEPRHASLLVWVYNDTHLIIWRCSHICRTRRESLGSEIGFFFGIHCLSQWRNREYNPEGFLCMRLCVCECVRACGACRYYTKRAFWWPSTPSLSAKPCAGTWFPQDDRRTIWPVFWS